LVVGKKTKTTSVAPIPSLLSDFLRWVFGAAPSRHSRLFVRDIRVSQEIRAFINHDSRTRAQKEAFAELLLRLDADPVSHSWPILNPPVPGLRWATFLNFKVILLFDPSHDRVSVATIEL